ncbi:MAG: permease [Actinobacteria bacterium]|nr:permease [Actinomycetota bacterium]MBA3728333.1 permease [Actinomycetota bacterium]
MVDLARPAPPRTGSWTNVLLLGGGLALAALVLRAIDPGRIAGLQNFFIIFGSLLIEAVPFIVMGAVVSAGIEVFVPARAFDRMATLPKPLQLPVAGIAGFAFPVCECGSVPVARRLAAKGLSPAAAVTFMLSAPILNPIVIASTYVAYRGRDTLWAMVLGRSFLGLMAAMAVGWVVAGRSSSEILRPRPDEEHHHESGPRWSSFAGHLAGDFLFMGRYLVIGAAAAALLQTFVPQSIIGSVADTPVLALVAMMGLAFVLSLCSESDAFVAASFVQFGVGAQLAFLVFGPMVDTKLGILYSATFSKGFFRMVVLVVGTVTLMGTLWIEVLVG